MTRVAIHLVELYEPWDVEVGESTSTFWDTADVPDDLLHRFAHAKVEMVAVWGEIRTYIRPRP